MDLHKDFENYLKEENKSKLDIPIIISLYPVQYKSKDSKEGLISSNKIILGIDNENSITSIRVDNYDEVYKFIGVSIRELLERYLKQG